MKTHTTKTREDHSGVKQDQRLRAARSLARRALASAWGVGGVGAITALTTLTTLAMLTISPPSWAQQAAPTEYGYDPEGNLTFIKDPLGRITEQTPDNLGRIQSQRLPVPTPEDPQPQITYTYDGQNRLKSVTDALGNTTTYTYSGLGDLALLSPDTGSSTWLLNEMGLLAYKQDARGTELWVDYDELHRPIRSASTGGYSEFIYDQFSTTAGAENYGRGRLTALRERGGMYLSIQYALNWAYDPQGRIVRQCQRFASPYSSCTSADTLSLQWGAANTPDTGRLLRQTYPSGRQIDYQYNALGQVVQLSTTDPAGSSAQTAAQTVLKDITYTALDVAQGGYTVSGWTFGAGPQAYRRHYDSSARVEMYTLGKGTAGNVSYGAHQLTWDDAGQLTQIDRFLGSWSSASFDHDGLGRLSQVRYNGAFRYSYGYDLNGNRTVRVATSGSTGWGYDSASNRLLSVQTGQGSTPVSTDVVGNTEALTTTGANGGTTTLTHDLRIDQTHGRLVASSGPQGSYSYQYNGLGQRVRKTGSGAAQPYIGSTDTIFYYDTQGHLIAEMDASTKQVKREYLWLGDTPVAMVAGSDPTQMVTTSNPPAIYYIHSDHLNTPRLVSDTSQRRRWDWSPVTNEPFGATQPNATATAGQPPLTLNLRFPGQYFDSETGTAYNHFRTYHPAWGRYLQSDPIGLEGGLNTFLYVGGNPLSYSDPMGLAAGGVKWLNPPRPKPPCKCPPVPPAPPGASVCKNMDEADDHWDPRWFRDQVQNKGPWDYKQQGPKYQNFGNFNYGATGSAFGFPGQVLSRMAGWAQQQAGTSKAEWGSPFGSAPYGDDPNDQEMIQQGIDYARCKCR